MKLQISIEVLVTLAISFAVAALLAGGLSVLKSSSLSYAAHESVTESGAYNALAAFQDAVQCYPQQGVVR
ncbi:MAG: hypothetical protein M1321_03065 [Candidatus Marsarchaeota archaeon]|nr:hypothetical protein [Candidatus Marsarchaeota archaeon]